MNWKECFLQWVWTNAGGKSVAVNAVLGYAEDEVAGQPRTGPAGSLDCHVQKDPPRLETIWMGPPIRIMTRCISAWPIFGLAPETLPCARENRASWQRERFRQVLAP
jgi:hypothetical protein